jgi:hypothetical protein
MVPPLPGRGVGSGGDGCDPPGVGSGVGGCGRVGPCCQRAAEASLLQRMRHVIATSMPCVIPPLSAQPPESITSIPRSPRMTRSTVLRIVSGTAGFATNAAHPH